MNHTGPEPIAISILAKAPIPGFAKTRLASVLGDEGAAKLQALFIARTIATARAAAIGPVTLWATPDDAHPVFRKIAECGDAAVACQPDGDLGRRMFTALAAAPPGIVIGTDCAVLTSSHLRAAADLLRTYDSVVIPAEDGGYVLIGVRVANPLLFSGMPWSTARVMEETRKRLRELCFSWREMGPLWDVDGPDDLERMRREGLFGRLTPTSAV